MTTGRLHTNLHYARPAATPGAPDFCNCCGEDWPCTVRQLLDRIAEMERENAKLCAQNAELVDENATVNRMFEDTDSAFCMTLDELDRARETLAAIADTPMKDTMGIAEAWTVLLRLTVKARTALWEQPSPRKTAVNSWQEALLLQRPSYAAWAEER